MYSVELYNRVRRACHVEGMSERESARLFGIDRKTVSKILKHSVPPGYRRQATPQRPNLDPFVPVIDQILEEDKSKLKKQRHTSKRIHARLGPFAYRYQKSHRNIGRFFVPQSSFFRGILFTLLECGFKT